MAVFIEKCPFCGNQPRFSVQDCRVGCGYGFCPIQGEWMAVRDWNWRAPNPLEARVKELEAEVESYVLKNAGEDI